MKINNKLIRTFKPCYDPIEVVKDENESLEPLEWVQKYRGKLPDKDIIWLLCRNEFLSDKSLRLFAVWCAREALKLVKNPDPLSIEACNVAERFANDEATNEELYAARAAARAYATAAKWNGVMATIRDAACDAALPASMNAARASAREAAMAAAMAVLWDEAEWDIAREVAAKDAARVIQLDKLLTYFTGGTEMKCSICGKHMVSTADDYEKCICSQCKNTICPKCGCVSFTTGSICMNCQVIENNKSASINAETAFALPSQQEIDKAVDEYAFRVPYDGSNKFYNEEALKHFRAGIEWTLRRIFRTNKEEQQ